MPRPTAVASVLAGSDGPLALSGFHGWRAWDSNRVGRQDRSMAEVGSDGVKAMLDVVAKLVEAACNATTRQIDDPRLRREWPIDKRAARPWHLACKAREARGLRLGRSPSAEKRPNAGGGVPARRPKPAKQRSSGAGPLSGMSEGQEGLPIWARIKQTACG
jgi:hypothetical protein